MSQRLFRVSYLERSASGSAPRGARAPVVELERVRVRERVHHLDLVDDLVHLALLDALDGDVVHRLLLAALEDLGLAPGADLVEDVVLVLRAARR